VGRLLLQTLAPTNPIESWFCIVKKMGKECETLALR
jgi:hypothetical protein